MMKPTIWKSLVAALIITLMISACSQPTPEEQINQTLEEMITALESGNKDKILHEYAIVPQDQDITTRDFSQDKADQLLIFLKEAKQITPTISNDLRTIRYKVPSSRQELIFSKEKDRWKLNN